MRHDASTGPHDSPVRDWMPRDRWDALVRGEDCAACAEVRGLGLDNGEGYFVTDLAVSRLRLQRDARHPAVPGRPWAADADTLRAGRAARRDPIRTSPLA